MDYIDWDIPETIAVSAGVSRSWRKICHSRQHRASEQAGYRRRLRRAVRQAIVKGGFTRDIPRALTPWDIT